MTKTRRKPTAPAQLSFFTLIEAPPADAPIPEWVTGAVVDRAGMDVYLHLIRSPEDPERADIRLLPAELRDRGAEWLKSLMTSGAADWHAPILALLADHVPRTFNRIGVELLDKTADILLETPPDEALWALVAAREVEHTMSTPVFFRLVKPT